MPKVETLATVAWLCLVSSVVGQHIHEAHPPQHHGPRKEWYRSGLESKGFLKPVVKLTSKGNRMIFNEWLINSTCNDDVERGNSYTKSVTHKVHVSVSPSWEWGTEASAKALALELKATAKARVELNVGWEGTWKEELSFSSKTKLKRCQKIWYVFVKNRRRAEGYVNCYEHKVTCRNWVTGQTIVNYCSVKKMQGFAVGWGTHIGEHVQRGLVKNCPCADIDPETEHVFTPDVLVPVPELEGSEKPVVSGDPGPGTTIKGGQDSLHLIPNRSR